MYYTHRFIVYYLLVIIYIEFKNQPSYGVRTAC